MVGDSGLIQLRQAALLRTQTARKVAKMVYAERNVSVERLSDRLPVVDGLHVSQLLLIRLKGIGNLQQDMRALSRASLAPGISCSVRCVQSKVNVGSVAASSLPLCEGCVRREGRAALVRERARAYNREGRAACVGARARVHNSISPPTCVKIFPVVGVGTSKYRPLTGGTHLPPCIGGREVVCGRMGRWGG